MAKKVIKRGQEPSVADIAGLMGPLGIPAGLLAGVKPDKIKFLKNQGKRIVDLIKSNKSLREVGGLREFPVDDKTIEALEIAQDRWPRIFGHILDISDTGALQKLGDMIRGRITTGVAEPALQNKFSRLKLNTDVASRTDLPRAMQLPQTIAHELLHSADRIAMGNDEMRKAYEFSMKLPGGYNVSAMEMRARLMGDRMDDIIAATRKAGKRSVTGKNPFVPQREYDVSR